VKQVFIFSSLHRSVCSSGGRPGRSLADSHPGAGGCGRLHGPIPHRPDHGDRSQASSTQRSHPECRGPAAVRHAIRHPRQ